MLTLYHWEPNANSGKPMLTLAEKEGEIEYGPLKNEFAVTVDTMKKTVDEKLNTVEVHAPHLRRETAAQHRTNLAFTAALLVIVLGLWVYFR